MPWALMDAWKAANFLLSLRNDFGDVFAFTDSAARQPNRLAYHWAPPLVNDFEQSHFANHVSNSRGGPRLRSFAALGNALYGLAALLAHEVKLVRTLKVHPEISGHAEILAET